MTKRKETGIEWLRVLPASKRLGLPRSTLLHRIAKGEHRTKSVGGTLFVAVPKQAADAAA